jgi:[ribosomal protein S18]-alanine N-acetyltransferase
MGVMDHDPGEVIIRAGAPADAAAILGIQASSGGAAQWDPHDYLNYMLWVAEGAGSIQGFVVARTVAEGEGEILNLAVHPDCRRRGIASRLLRRVLEHVRGSLFLEVRASNRGAIEFYQAAGFRRAGVRRGYYSQPDDDAAVMRIGS